MLTAAHCTGLLPEGQSEAVVGRSIQAEGARHIRITKALRHPDWASPVHDVALVQLAEEAGVEPVTLIDPIDTAWHAGNLVTLVGYGRDEHGQTGTRRSGEARVSEMMPKHFRIRPEPALSCAGDSGGPALALIDGAPRVAGVASYGDPMCIGIATYARLDIELMAFVRPGIEQLQRFTNSGHAPLPAPDPCVNAGGPVAAGGGCAVALRGPAYAGDVALVLLVVLALARLLRTSSSTSNRFGERDRGRG